MPKLNAYNGDDINPQYVDAILEQIDSGGRPYMDVCEMEDMINYLTSVYRHKDALKLTRYGLQLHPNSNELMLQQALLMLDNNEIESAWECLKYVKPAMGDDPDYHIACGWYYLKKENKKRAMEEFDIAVELDNGQQGLEYEIGMNLNQFGMHKEALKYLKAFNAAMPNDPEGLFELAFALDKTGDFDESRTKYEELVDINPFYETAWYNLGIQYNITNDYEKAIMAYDTAVTINPEYPEPYFNMGNTHMNNNHVEEALNNYIEYATLCEPDQMSSAMQSIGECWWELGNNEMSRKFYQWAAENNPDDQTVLYGLALNDIELNMYDEAIEMLDRAIEIETDNADYRFAKAQALFQKNKMRESYEELIAGIEIEPNIVFAWMEAYKIYIKEICPQEPWTFYEKYWDKYFEYGAFKMMATYHLWKIKREERLAIETIEWLAKNDKETIEDALEEEDLKKMLLTKPYIDILKEAGYKL